MDRTCFHAYKPRPRSRVNNQTQNWSRTLNIVVSTPRQTLALIQIPRFLRSEVAGLAAPGCWAAVKSERRRRETITELALKTSRPRKRSFSVAASTKAVGSQVSCSNTSLEPHRVNKRLGNKQMNKPPSVVCPSGPAAVSGKINLSDCWFSKCLGQPLDRDTSGPSLSLR